MKKNCSLCGSIFKANSAASSYKEACCPACLNRIEEIVLSEGLVIPAPVNFYQAVPIFEKYFQKYCFSEFEKYVGCSVCDFIESYENLKIYVEGYYEGYCESHGYRYAPDEVRYPLVAEVSSYCIVDFFVTMGKDDRIHYPAVSILDGDYYVSLPPKQIEFLDCEQVMKMLLLLYWGNKDFFDEGKALAESHRQPSKVDPFEYVGDISLGNFSFE